MNWQDKPEVAKGNLGEEIVDQYLMAQGIIPYRPINDGAHPFDRIAASRDKKYLCVVETKAKAHRMKYPDTGINYAHCQEYLPLSMSYGMDVFLYFVDHEKRSIYGGELISELMRETQVQTRRGWQFYPWAPEPKHGPRIIYFALESMTHIADLTDEQCAELGGMTNGARKQQVELDL